MSRDVYCDGNGCEAHAPYQQTNGWLISTSGDLCPTCAKIDPVPLPCPWCQEQPSMADNDPNRSAVFCDSDICDVLPLAESAMGVRSAVAIWNDRRQPAPTMLSAKDVAERWGLRWRHVLELCKSGRIAAVKFGRDWRIPRELVERIERGEQGIGAIAP